MGGRALLRAENWPRVQLKTEHLPTKAANANLGFQKLPDLAVQAQQKRRWMRCVSSSRLFDGPVVFSVESEGRREALGELLARIKIAPQRIMRLDEASDRGRYLMIGAAEHGFVDKVRNLALICESDLLGERVARRRQDSRRTINPDTLIRNLRSCILVSRWSIWGARCRALCRNDHARSGRHYWRVFDAHLCQRRQTVCSGVVTASD